jgi:hydroxyacylglutathione hydrolase
VFFRQVLHDDLGCASYVVADGGEAAVIDPKWEIDDYLALAEEHGFGIAHVLETHNHADHVSGHGRLAAATGATIHVSGDAGVEYEHEPLADGDVVSVGDARITALATPGHRPEHLAFLVFDAERADAPWLVVTGDSLFVGDLARPDLAVEPRDGAEGLFRSLRRLLELEDFAEVWPGHIGGSLCGGAGMSQKPASTIGFERRYNRFARLAEEDEFVRALTGQLAPQPPNFRRIVELNRGPLLTDAAPLEPLAPARVKEVLVGGTLVDGRDPREFDAAHVPGSINVTMTRSAVGTRAAWVVDPDVDVVVSAATDEEARRLGRLLEAVGIRNLRGYLAGGVAAWRDAGLAVGSTPALDVAALAERIRGGEVFLLDVRDADEWREGHVEGSLHVPYHDLRDGVPAALPANGKPIVVACSVGNRSSIAASLLRRAGVENVVHVADGGVADLSDEGIALVTGP